MKRLAIVGSGIAGLGAAHFLHRDHEITVLEKNDYPGGHSNTILVPEKDRKIPVDTGFMVYNEVTYPLLTRLFRELNVETKPTSMSFSVSDRGSGLEYCGSGVNALFAQRLNLLRPRFWRLLSRIDRFNREAIGFLENPSVRGLSLENYVRGRGYGEDFLNLYLLPMTSAVWSAPPQKMREFPAATLLRFFHNHGFLGLHTQHPWRTVSGGSRCYVQKLIAPFRDRIEADSPVAAIRRVGGSVQVTTAGQIREFDAVILACHADEALEMLDDASPLERSLLRNFRYQRNTAILHRDSSVMPRTRRAWASWNYRIDPALDAHGKDKRYTTHYWMNSLQKVSERENYFVSINGGDIAPDSVIRSLSYDHPLFDLPAMRAQFRLHELNEADTGVYFCGSYFRYGFHEDAFWSAEQVARHLLKRDPWSQSTTTAASDPDSTPCAVAVRQRQ